GGLLGPRLRAGREPRRAGDPVPAVPPRPWPGRLLFFRYRPRPRDHAQAGARAGLDARARDAPRLGHAVLLRGRPAAARRAAHARLVARPLGPTPSQNTRAVVTRSRHRPAPHPMPST